MRRSSLAAHPQAPRVVETKGAGTDAVGGVRVTNHLGTSVEPGPRNGGENKRDDQVGSASDMPALPDSGPSRSPVIVRKLEASQVPVVAPMSRSLRYAEGWNS